MIFKLIHWELLKVLKKKSIYIIWALMLLFCFFNTFLYKKDYDTEGRYLYEKSENLEEEITTLEKEANDPSLTSDTKITLKTKIELLKLKKEFSPNSWQYFKINDYLYDALLEEKKNPSIKKETYTYQELVTKLKQDDYLFFFKREKINLQNQIHLLKERALNEEENKSTIEEAVSAQEKALKILNYRIKEGIKEDNGYLNQALLTYISASEKLEKLSNTKKTNQQAYQEAKKEKKISETILKKKINYQQENTTSALIRGLLNDYEFFFIIILLITSSQMICDEFQKGTFKFLLIKPASRFIIILSKYFTSLFVLLISILLLFTFQFILGGIFFGLKDWNLGGIIYDYHLDKVIFLNLGTDFFIHFIAKLPLYLMISLISLIIGVITASTILSVIIPFMLSVSSGTLLELAISHRLSWIKYLPNMTWRFSDYLFGSPSRLEGLNFHFSIVWYSIYFIISFLFLIKIFQRKDIKNV